MCLFISVPAVRGSPSYHLTACETPITALHLQERLGQKMSALVLSVAKITVPAYRKHFDVVVACEDDEGEDLDVPLVSIEYR